MQVTLGLFSHLYALMRVMPISSGPVVELGVGIGSTPFLHWACHPNRKLVSYETNEKYYKLMRGHISPNHEMHLLDNWDKADLERPWAAWPSFQDGSSCISFLRFPRRIAPGRS